MVKLIFYLLLGFIASNNSFSQKIKCYQISNVAPLIDMEGKITSYDTGIVRLYLYGNKRIYNLEYQYDSMINGQSVLSEIRHHQLIFYKDSIYGYHLDSKKSSEIRLVKVDSILKNEWVSLNNVYPVLTNNISKLISRNLNKDSSIVSEYYSLKDKKDSSEIGSCMFVFQKNIPLLDISLSKELDTNRDMKLFKTQIISFKRFVKEYNLTLQKFEMLMEIKEIPVQNESEILRFFSIL